MDAFENVFRRPGAEHKYESPCGEGVVTTTFVITTQYDSTRSLKDILPKDLPQVTSQVHVKISPTGKQTGTFSARFTAVECAELFGDKWPNGESFGRIARAVLDRKRYPMPLPEIPGGGGKSNTAQGQTKKEGSHSQDRHR